KEMPEQDYYIISRVHGRQNVLSSYTIDTRPIDKTDNYIKRCIGIPGDVVEIRDGIVHINNAPSTVFPHSKMEYLIVTNGTHLNQDVLEEHDVDVVNVIGNQYTVLIENEHVPAIQKQPQ